MENVLTLIVYGAASVFLMMFLFWLVYLKTGNAGVVDIGWGLGFVVLMGVYIALGEGFTLRTILLLVMVSFWGLRLAWHILNRAIFEGKEDKRYQKFRSEWGGNLHLKFFLFYEFQALLQVVLSIPFVYVCLNPYPGLGWPEMLGFAVWIIGYFGESIADEQLKNFVRNPANKGKTCQQGLWRCSRHPNYFFECVLWLGYFIFALASPNGWIGVVSPLLITYLITKVSGIPLAEEQSLKSRGDEYRRYQEATSAFIPLPRKT